MTQSSKEPTSRIAAILKKRADELGYDLYDISDHTRCTYEYARRLLAGTSIPTTSKLMDIIEGLQFDAETAVLIEKMAEEDRATHDQRRRANRSPNYPKVPGQKKDEDAH